MSPCKTQVCQYNLKTKEVKALKISNYLKDLKDTGVYVDLNGTVVISGGFNTVLLRPEFKSLMIDAVNERTIDMANMLEPKMKH